MLHLAIDVGEITGWCYAYLLIAPDGTCLTQGSFRLEISYAPWEIAWAKFHKFLSLPTLKLRIILERSPQTALDYYDNCNKIIQIAKYCNEMKAAGRTIQVAVISPNEWKPVAKARGWKEETSLVSHEQDAINQLRYWAWKQYKTELVPLSPCSNLVAIHFPKI